MPFLCEESEDGCSEPELFQPGHTVPVEVESINEAEPGRGPGRPRMSGADMRNSVAAGRGRALSAAPIPDGYICEWALLGKAGGGIVPIVGCYGNLASDRHHGPDKSTLNNEVGINLHRVCDDCHAHWHELNDRHYPERPVDNGCFLPSTGVAVAHDRLTRATDDELLSATMWWHTPLETRPAYREWTKTRLTSN